MSISTTHHGSPARQESIDRFRETYANWSAPSSVVLSFDIDFVPDFMLESLVDRIEAAGVGATFFVTHPTPVLSRIAQNPRFELGIHPYASPKSTQGDGLPDITDRLISICTDAGAPRESIVSSRFHRLQFAYRDLAVLAHRGIRHDCSSMRFNTPYVLPAHQPDLNMSLMGYTWEDGTCEASPLPVRAASIDLTTPGLKILTMHPLNIYLNGPTAEHRLSFLSSLEGPLTSCSKAAADPHRLSGDGASTALDEVLELISEQGLRTPTMGEVGDAFMSTWTEPAEVTA